MDRKDLDSLILYQNADYVVVNKPAGIATVADRTDEINVLSELKNHDDSIMVCHRIDKNTSGAVVFAKNPEAHRHLSLQFQERTVVKTYHAIVQGRTDLASFLVNVPLIIKSQGIVKWDSRRGKESSTVFTTLQNYRSHSLLDCRPVTGRRHQIRVHLKYLGHPIVGDTMYGGQDVFLSQIKRKYKQKSQVEKPVIRRLALHAKSISFSGLDSANISVEAPYPKDLAILIRQLVKYSNG